MEGINIENKRSKVLMYGEGDDGIWRQIYLFSWTLSAVRRGHSPQDGFAMKMKNIRYVLLR